MRADLFVRRTGLGRDPIDDVGGSLRPAPPLAKRLNRNALTVAAVIMGMTVLTAVVLLNPKKEIKVSSASSANVETVPQSPAHPSFLDEPVPRSLPAPTTDSGPSEPKPSAATGIVESNSSPASPSPAITSGKDLVSEPPVRAMSESPRQRGYRAALMSPAVPGGIRSETSATPTGDAAAAPTEEEQMVKLADSITRSALRPHAPVVGQTASSDAEHASLLSNEGASQQSFSTKAAEATAKSATSSQLSPAGSPYTLRAGTIIPALLITGITSDLPGDIVGQVSRDVYDSRSQQILLIPRGSRLIGTYDNQIAAGQGRLLVAWTRLLLPDGRSMQLPGLPLTDTEGNSGATGKVDNHWRRVFGNALLLSALSAGLQLSQPSEATVLATPSAGQVAAGAVGQELSTVAMEIIKRGMSAAPTITIPAGQAFNVMLNGDIVFDEPFVPRP